MNAASPAIVVIGVRSISSARAVYCLLQYLHSGLSKSSPPGAPDTESTIRQTREKTEAEATPDRVSAHREKLTHYRPEVESLIETSNLRALQSLRKRMKTDRSAAFKNWVNAARLTENLQLREDAESITDDYDLLLQDVEDAIDRLKHAPNASDP